MFFDYSTIKKCIEVFKRTLCIIYQYMAIQTIAYKNIDARIFENY